MIALAQGCAGLALVMCFALLGTRQVSAAAILLSVQSLAVATCALALRQPVIAAMTVAANGIGAVWFVRRQMHGFAVVAPPSGGAKLGILAGAALAALAQTRGQMAEPLAVMLLSVLLAATRRHSLMHVVALVSLQNGLGLAAAEAATAPLAALPGFLLAIPLGMALAADRPRALRLPRLIPFLGWAQFGCAILLLAATLVIPLDPLGVTFAPLVAAWGIASAWAGRTRRRSGPARLADLLKLIAMITAVAVTSPLGGAFALGIAMTAAVLPTARRRLDALVVGPCATGLALFGIATMKLGEPLVSSVVLFVGIAATIAVAPELGAVAGVILLRLSVHGPWPAEASFVLTSVAAAGLLACALLLVAGPPRRRIAPLRLAQAALAALAIGLDDPQGRFAAAVVLILLMLTDAAVVMSRPGGGLAEAAARAGLAGIPPLGVFPGIALLLLAAGSLAPWLLPPIGLGLAAMIVAGTPSRPRHTGSAWMRSVAWAPLGVALAFGYAAPDELVRWLSFVTAGTP
jgi:hypothetical protein